MPNDSEKDVVVAPAGSGLAARFVSRMNAWGGDIAVGTMLALLPLPGISGPLVSRIADHIVKQVLGQVLPADTASIEARAKEAAEHLSAAAGIMTRLQEEITRNDGQLRDLIHEIEKRKEEAAHWDTLASMSKETADTVRAQIEEGIRSELDRGKTPRRVVAMAFWLLTLVLGAVLGVACQEWWNAWMRAMPR